MNEFQKFKLYHEDYSFGVISSFQKLQVLKIDAENPTEDEIRI